MGTRRHYLRLSTTELDNLRSRPEEAIATLDQRWTDDVKAPAARKDITDPPGEARLYDIDKYWEDLDLVLEQAGISLDEANGSDHIPPFDPRVTEEFDWEWMDDIGRRFALGPSYLTVGAVKDLAARLSSVNFDEVFEGVSQEKWDELVLGPAEHVRDDAIAISRSVSQFFDAAARAGDAVVSVMR